MNIYQIQMQKEDLFCVFSFFAKVNHFLNNHRKKSGKEMNYYLSAKKVKSNNKYNFAKTNSFSIENIAFQLKQQIYLIVHRICDCKIALLNYCRC